MVCFIIAGKALYWRRTLQPYTDSAAGVLRPGLLLARSLALGVIQQQGGHDATQPATQEVLLAQVGRGGHAMHTASSCIFLHVTVFQSKAYHRWEKLYQMLHMDVSPASSRASYSYRFRFLLQLRRHKARCHLLDPVSGVAAAHDGEGLQLPPNLVQNPGFDRILPSDSQRADEWSFHGQGYSLVKVRDGFVL